MVWAYYEKRGNESSKVVMKMNFEENKERG